MDVILASCVELPEPDPDQAPLTAALEAAGIRAIVRGWDDPASRWQDARMTLLRSTWNYPLRPAAFLSWARLAARLSDLWNPLSLVKWNIHKRYLLDLEREGIAITPTELVPQGSSLSLGEILTRRGWQATVVKPAVSAASYRTRHIDAHFREDGETHLRALAAAGDVLVQEYLPSVEEHGERSLVWIDGDLTHAVRKSSRFDGEEESASIEAVEISTGERDLAERALSALAGLIPQAPMYARIDTTPGPDGAPLLMELELIEPSLYFRQSAHALELFVEAVRKRLGR